MNRCLIALLAVLSLTALTAAAPAAEKMPNVVVILADDKC